MVAAVAVVVGALHLALSHPDPPAPLAAASRRQGVSKQHRQAPSATIHVERQTQEGTPSPPSRRRPPTRCVHREGKLPRLLKAVQQQKRPMTRVPALPLVLHPPEHGLIPPRRCPRRTRSPTSWGAAEHRERDTKQPRRGKSARIFFLLSGSPVPTRALQHVTAELLTAEKGALERG